MQKKLNEINLKKISYNNKNDNDHIKACLLNKKCAAKYSNAS